MPLLIATTVFWAFSFSLIGVYLSGQVDNWFAVLMRVALALLVFLPFARWRGLALQQVLLFMLVGACQLGVMYLFYYSAFLYLSVPELLLFTVMTPVYVTLLYDLLGRNSLRWGYLATAALAVAGAVIIRYNQPGTQFWIGLGLIQGANLCFAIGQVGYKRLMEVWPMPQHNAFFWFYVGAFCVAALGWTLFGDSERLPTTTLQWGILLWLGIGASGAGYFMWNYGATQVDAGTLAIMNNVLIPAGLLVNLIIWQQSPDWANFLSGSVLIMLSLWVHRRWVAVRCVQKVSAHSRAVKRTG